MLEHNEHPELSLEQLQARVTAWADKQFPDRVAAIAWMKFFEEIGEVLKNPQDPLEWADVMILFLDLAKMHKIHLTPAVLEKLMINHERSWGVGPSGLMQHTCDPRDKM